MPRIRLSLIEDTSSTAGPDSGNKHSVPTPDAHVRQPLTAPDKGLKYSLPAPDGGWGHP